MASPPASTPGWLLLDRDDTILDDPGYLADPEGVRFLPGALEGLQALARAGWPLVVVSNQSGIGRGRFSWADLEAVHDRFRRLLAGAGVQLAGIYVCPHHPEDGCACRKPEPGLAERAAQELGLALDRAVVVGDKPSDVALGRRIRAAYVAQIRAKEQPLAEADGVFASLDELARYLLPDAPSGG